MLAWRDGNELQAIGSDQRFLKSSSSELRSAINIKGIKFRETVRRVGKRLGAENETATAAAGLFNFRWNLSGQ